MLKTLAPRDIDFGIEIECTLPIIDPRPPGRRLIFFSAAQQEVSPRAWNNTKMLARRIKRAMSQAGAPAESIDIDGGRNILEKLADPLASRLWKVGLDSSIREKYGEGRLGFEIRSPILSGEADFNQLRDVLVALRDIGARTNATCGFHLHVSPRGRRFRRRELRTFAAAALLSERQYHRLIDPSRHENYYCRRYSVIPETREELLDKKRTNHPAPDGRRYVKLNLSNAEASRGRLIEWIWHAAKPLLTSGVQGIVRGKTTIEFRGKEGVDFNNIEKTMNYVGVMLHFASRAKKDPDFDIRAAIKAYADRKGRRVRSKSRPNRPAEADGRIGSVQSVQPG